MKKTYAFVFSPLLIFISLIWAEPKQLHQPSVEVPTEIVVNQLTSASQHTAAIETPANITAVKSVNSEKSKAIVTYAMSLIGSPYVYAGITPEGFDCSGFITHVFSQYAVAVPHSSAMQANEGEHVSQEQASIGDLVIFTGTDATLREPGHVGIVITSPGEPIEFVHASSNGGVKVSQLEGTRYDFRFLEVRRIL